MDEETKKEIRKMIRQEILKILPEIFGRSLLQIKQFFTSNIL